MGRSALEPYDITAVIDTREQLPFTLEPLKTVRGSLATGDYSVLGLEHLIAMERKSLPDLIACVGVERERFDKEIKRLAAYESKAIIVEASWKEFEAGGWRSRVTPSAAMGSVLGWVAGGIPIIFPGNRETADTVMARLLFIAARRRWRELQSLVHGLKVV